jgi:hypothetical protein
VRKLIQKLSSQKRVAQLAKQSAYVFHAMFAPNVLSTHSLTMSASEFGAVFQNVSAVA